MTTRDQDHLADDEFAAFLQGEGILARDLQALSHPEPSAAMSAAILKQVKSDLAQGAKSLPETSKHAANDVSMPGASAPIRPSFMSRWRTPMALAASILCTVLLLLQWQQQSPIPIVAQVLPPTLPKVTSMATEQNVPVTPAIVDTPQVASATKSALSAPAAAPVKKNREIAPAAPAAPAIQIAQADISELNANANPTATRSMPKPAAGKKVVEPQQDASAPAVDVEKAKAWLTLIDEMIKADLRQDALIEWEKFHKAYPHYKVPGNLMVKIKALKK